MSYSSRAVIALLAVLASNASAPETAETRPATSEPAYLEVVGIADNDLLNLRATASAGGMVIGRLPNGSRVKNLGCSEVKGYRWCKIVDLVDAKVAGWAAERYLVETAVDPAELPSEAPADSASQGADVAALPSDKTEAPKTGFDATGIIPCARQFGQPMSLCQAGVVRGDAGQAIISVTWPEGGERIIRFRDGKPESSNAEEEFRFTREADLNMIRIGKGERFEIPDALPFGG
ncbi:MAG: SH3 domain-containing protein [Rhizobiaceae bacterium]